MSSDDEIQEVENKPGGRPVRLTLKMTVEFSDGTTQDMAWNLTPGLHPPYDRVSIRYARKTTAMGGQRFLHGSRLSVLVGDVGETEVLE